jgi:hypothetical protein
LTRPFAMAEKTKKIGSKKKNGLDVVVVFN